MNLRRIIWLFLLNCTIISLFSTGILIQSTETNQTKLIVYPPEINDPSIQQGYNFTIQIRVIDVKGLMGYEFCLYWKPDLLNYTKVTEGPFLKQGGSTYFLTKKYQDEGYMLVSCTLKGQPFKDAYPVDGSGVLTYITFTVEKIGSTQLHLNGTKLLEYGLPPDYSPQPINHTVEDGYFSNIPPTHAVAITDFHVSPNSVLPGSIVAITVTITNEGTFNETIALNIYCDDDLITQFSTINLNFGETLVMNFTWNTTNVKTGFHKMVAEIPPLLNELDIEDNIANEIIEVKNLKSGGHSGKNVLW